MENRYVVELADEAKRTLPTFARRARSQRSLDSSRETLSVGTFEDEFSPSALDFNIEEDEEEATTGEESSKSLQGPQQLENVEVTEHSCYKKRWGFAVAVVVVTVVIASLTASGVLYKFGYFGNSIDDDRIKEGDPEQPTFEAKLWSTVGQMRNGVVATDHEACSSIGVDILRKGGNAVDSAVAAALCLGVANPSSSGIGGGCFILINVDDMSRDETRMNRRVPIFDDARDPSFQQPNPGKILEVVDCRDVAPQLSSEGMFNGKPESSSTIGGLAIAVPGELRGLEVAHARHGKLSWEDVVAPSVALAKRGVPVSSYLAAAIKEHAGENMQFQALKKLLSKGGHEGSPLLEEGDTLKNPKLASVLEQVKTFGSDAVYNGELTHNLTADIQKAGGIIKQQDFLGYKPILRTPLVASDIQGHTIVSVPPPSSGGATLIGAARFLAGYEDLNSPSRHHRLVEAMKHAFAIRMSLSDPAFRPVLNSQAVKDLTKGGYMDMMRRNTGDTRVLPLSLYGGVKWNLLNTTKAQTGNSVDMNEGDRRQRNRRQLMRFGYLNDHGTSSLSVIDKELNAVSITSSVNTHFGSGVVSESTGIVLNSQMDDFSTPGRPNFFGMEPSEANYIQPGKRPLSSMSPTFVFEHSDTGLGLGDLKLALGGSGGPKIITAVLQVVWNAIFGDMDLFDSVMEPRLHDQLVYHNDAVTTFEKTMIRNYVVETSASVLEELKQSGHNLLALNYLGCVQAVQRNLMTGRMTGVSDIRKGGRPAGY